MVSVSPDSVRTLEVPVAGERHTAITFPLYVSSNGSLLIKEVAVIFFKVVMVIWVACDEERTEGSAIAGVDPDQSCPVIWNVDWVDDVGALIEGFESETFEDIPIAQQPGAFEVIWQGIKHQVVRGIKVWVVGGERRNEIEL